MVFHEKKTIALVIKTPNQAHGDQRIEDVDTEWTVKELKTYLSRVYPNNPLESDQRLIYSGKLLPDHLHVRDIFRKTDLTPTVHLVCAIRTQPRGPLGARPKVREAEQHETQSSTIPTRQNPDATQDGTVPTDPEPRQRRPTTASPAQWPGTTTPAEITNPTFPTYSLYSPQQLLWLQHMYARQYYMQYQAAYAAAASAPLTPVTSLPVAPHQAAVAAALPNQGPIDNLPANQNAQDAAFINPGVANQNLRMNAQGGPVMEDEEDMNRDWLDWVYTAARLGVFLSIVYFYSSLSRFVLVMSSLFLMYMHTAGWFPFRQRALVRGLQNQVPEVMQNQQNQDRNPVPPAEVPAGEEGVQADVEVRPDEPHLPAAVLVPQHRVSMVWTAWIFFKAFFASLIPEAPALAH
ncbi:hypothetical protein UPYG_G00263290 [Umbra pygmaea]|uniref:Ubiquitin-like domain-containing protein n=1 Tax=Umbra pygmaea TaxID=75934 RepID=A0ABD0W9F6_UMBPY